MFSHPSQLIKLAIGILCFCSANADEVDFEKRLAQLEQRVAILTEQYTKRADLEEQLMQLKFAFNQSRRQAVSSQASLKDNTHEHEKLFAEIKQFLAQKDHQQAQFAINRYLSIYGQQSHQFEVKFELANLLAMQGDLLKAEPLLIAVSEQRKEAKAPDALLRLMTIYWQTGRNDKAEEAYHHLVSRYPRSPVAQLGKVQYKQWIKTSYSEA